MTSIPDKPAAAGTPRPRRRWRRWGMGVVAAALAMELVLRLVFGFANPVLTQPDPDCGYLCKPDQDLVRFFAHNHINHYGMRCGDIALHKPPGTLRIFLVGDSVTYGTTFVDQSKVFSSLLGRELPAVLGKPVEVLNISAGGWAPGNEVGYLKSRGTFESDWVIFVLNSGDPGEAFARFTPSVNFPTERPWSAIGEVWSRYAAPRLFHFKPAEDQGTAVPPDPQAEIPRNLALLGEAKTLIEASHGHMGIVFYPFRGAGWDPPGPLPELVQWSAQQKVPLIDLTADLVKHSVKEMTFDGMHPRAAGDRVVADRLVEELSRLAK